jgi:hypothetical protein
LTTPARISIAVNHEEEDHRLNVVVTEAVDLLANEVKRMYPKDIAPQWKRLQEALEAFTRVDMEAAERNYVVNQLMSMEKELGA